ncbi:DsbA family oxidoreductase [Paenibacillus daejeonensis]|uniref:DsbA family oxidoreductase n=1 Tax=Paenibacillus daejeonensis TaxID=135193 RepID=UPI00037E0C0D|nr:DsbA family oxidoreductase [Paenibacillus daejeonensis]
MHIDVYQDYVCPWCRIGKKNLSDALAQWQNTYDGEITVTYRAYQLHPELPPEGADFKEIMAAKMGGVANISQATGQVTKAGEAVGLPFHFDKITRMPNTELAHRLTAIAPEEHTTALVDALHQAYFAEGRDISDHAALTEILSGIGLDAQDLLARASQGEGAESVAADLGQAREIGIQGVPFFVFNQKYALSGAYPASELVRVLDSASGKADEL